MAFGRNVHSIELITKTIDFDMLFTLLKVGRSSRLLGKFATICHMYPSTIISFVMILFALIIGLK